MNSYLVCLALSTLLAVSNGVCCNRKPNFGCCGNGACNVFCCNCDDGCDAACENNNCDFGGWFECFGCFSGCAALCVVPEDPLCATCIIGCGGVTCCHCYNGAVCPSTRRRELVADNSTYYSLWDTCGSEHEDFEFDYHLEFPMSRNYFMAAAMGVHYHNASCIKGMFDDLDGDNSGYIEEGEADGTHRSCPNYLTSSDADDFGDAALNMYTLRSVHRVWLLVTTIFFVAAAAQ
mmetsp:Transcript_28961/g.47415  ORF Transcript_28961/g.47415 Transcript_28961/m.47415 type:complete len:234 (+) Transcript_28961:113-814(+)